MKALLAVLSVLSMVSCWQKEGPFIGRYWEVVPVPIECSRPQVEPYEVEFLPLLPENPQMIVVGKFVLHKGARLEYGDEEMMQSIKQSAAAIGGNTIVYPDNGQREVDVAYVPAEQSLHGGDEY
jgi:hypothetical protein